MSKLLLSIFVFLFLSGCTTCSPITGVKATAVTTPKELKVRSSIVGMYLGLPNKFDLIIQRCSSRQYDSSICGVITLRPNVHVRFGSSQTIVISVIDGKSDIYEMSSIKYSYQCNTKNGEKPVCDSSTESPTGKPTKVLGDSSELVYGSDNEFREVHARSFEPTLEFVGEKVKCWCAIDAREYQFTLIDEQLLNKPAVKAKLPNIWVDGREYVLPEINFSTATEEFCNHYELM
ncbi:MAG: hypothetical protein ACKVOA_09180 [Methylophilaceae bacterium]